MPHDPQDSALRALTIRVVQNGLIVVPRESRYRDGDETDCFVFVTVEQMAAWLLKQAWAFPPDRNTP